MRGRTPGSGLSVFAERTIDSPPMTPNDRHRIVVAVRSLVLAIASVAVLASAALAHPGGPEQVLVVGDHVDPGQSFQLLAAFIEADADVPVSVHSGSARFDLGSVRVGSDGQIDKMLTLPADVPLGYAELHLSQPTQGDAATIFLVGPRDAAASDAGGGSVLDTQAGALLMFVATLAGIVVVAVLLLRGGRTKRA